VVTFLLTNEAFPRSALYSVTELEAALAGIRGILGLTEPSQALRDTGELAARLRYADVDAGFMRELHDFLDGVELACNRIGEAVAAEYFGGRVPLRRGA
jgi:uncharacterized alpha-E superfamily protein